MSPDELARHLTIDLTTTGRRSGLPRRIEIWWFRVDEHFYITGTGGRRDWLANLRSDPNGIVHVAGHDILITAIEVDDHAERRRVLSDPQLSWYSSQEQLDQLVERAPMIRLVFTGPSHRQT
ncbi:MAG: nitroreductase family deazaflavin-dependent oxidoreductase [Acidimicrobiia bacterium]|nr:nitroreductase family deazaflavin-dependent oxidoreductase [Acidimicrobiia bacterium]MDH5421940.1 nitroreductase family deazaflavin-dependent oxidoreductase [Acidimicrobiia bacterium]MDH5502724.1 nitroreductase family deazaflavin-dependent oxidoreductase [Acidimicrobiia bacterium]